jgi:hypothetical protein
MYLTSIWLFRCYVWPACSSSEGIQIRPQSGANKNWRLMFNPDVSLMAYSGHGNSSNIRASLFSAPFLMASERFTKSGYES